MEQIAMGQILHGTYFWFYTCSLELQLTVIKMNIFYITFFMIIV